MVTTLRCVTSCELIKKLFFVWSALILCLSHDAKTTFPVIFLCVDCSIWLSVCFVYFAWVFVFCFMLFCAFWLRVYIFLFYFAFVFRSRARAAWEPLNGWPHTPTGGGLPLQCSLFLFFIFPWPFFFYHFHNLSSFHVSPRAAGEPQNGWTHAWAVPSTKLLFSIHHSLLLVIDYDLQLFRL